MYNKCAAIKKETGSARGRSPEGYSGSLTAKKRFPIIYNTKPWFPNNWISLSYSSRRRQTEIYGKIIKYNSMGLFGKRITKTDEMVSKIFPSWEIHLRDISVKSLFNLFINFAVKIITALCCLDTCWEVHDVNNTFFHKKIGRLQSSCPNLHVARDRYIRNPHRVLPRKYPILCSEKSSSKSNKSFPSRMPP